MTFHLEQAVEQYAEQISARHRDELVDHLQESIEALRSEGLEPEAAFQQAVENLGDAGLIRNELAAVRQSGTRRAITLAGICIGVSILWAIAMQWAETDTAQQWMLAGWWVTAMMPLAFLNDTACAKAEWVWIKRKLRLAR